MNRKSKIKILAFLMCMIGMFVFAESSDAFIVINEILADPASGIEGDANGDGTTSYSQDEFIEFVNFGNESIDISGWFINDGVKTRHVFGANTILLPYQYIVVFGGGDPNLPGVNWQVASSGSLGLNNSGDTISLFDPDSVLMTDVHYGSLAGNDQSIVRFPEGSGNQFVLHSEIPSAQGALYSPGTTIDGNPLGQTTVPEPATYMCFILGGLGLLVRNKLDLI